MDDTTPSTYAERYAVAKTAVDARPCPLCGAHRGELCYAESVEGQVLRSVEVTHVARLTAK